MKHHIGMHISLQLLIRQNSLSQVLVKMLFPSQIEDSLKSNISKRSLNRHQNSLQEDTVLLMWVNRHAYSTQSNKLTIPWQERGER